MELTAAEGRVLGCLVDRQVADLDVDGVSLDDLRYACNFGLGRDETVAFDDRTVEEALMALKSKGLVRFVTEGRNLGPVRYRHRADERWRLSPAELAGLAVLLLRGPQTQEEVRTALGEMLLDGPVDAGAVLDALAGRTPTPLAARFDEGRRGIDVLWAEVLTGRPTSEELREAYDRRVRRRTAPRPGPEGFDHAADGSSASAGYRDQGSQAAELSEWAEVADRLATIERRLAGIEAALAALRASLPAQPHESSRAIR
jgi:uncharacterized protein YceH (UPF0502 family)